MLNDPATQAPLIFKTLFNESIKQLKITPAARPTFLLHTTSPETGRTCPSQSGAAPRQEQGPSGPGISLCSSSRSHSELRPWALSSLRASPALPTKGVP